MFSLKESRENQKPRFVSLNFELPIWYPVWLIMFLKCWNVEVLLNSISLSSLITEFNLPVRSVWFGVKRFKGKWFSTFLSFYVVWFDKKWKTNFYDSLNSLKTFFIWKEGKLLFLLISLFLLPINIHSKPNRVLNLTSVCNIFFVITNTNY